jgi:ornithine cyclodeaminase/alanine dehydrogenase-like protein (mu-crystallin family)
MASSPPFPAAQFPVLIDAGLLRSLVPMPDAIEASRTAFTAAAAGELTGPLRSALSRHRVLVMPAEHSSGSAIIKVLSLQPDGWKTGLPSIGGSVLWVDGDSGRIAAMLDATSLTALRTGAASGLATSLLAPPGSSALAMLGAGGQAADQVAAVIAVRPVTEVRVFSRRRDRREDLCTQLAGAHPGVTFHPSGDSAEAVRGADVICTATRSTVPLFTDGDVGPEVHINAVGAYTAEMCEVPAAAFARASVVVIDQRAAAAAEAGDLIQAIAAGQLSAGSPVEIGDLLAGPAKPPGGLTIFKSVGIAAQDWALGDLVVSRARESGVMDDWDAGTPPGASYLPG